MMFLLWDSHGGFCVSRRRGKKHKQHLSSLITLHETCEQKRNVAKSMASIYLCPYCFVGALLPCLQRLNLNLQLRHSLSFSMHPASIRIDFTAIWTSDLVRRAFAPPVEVSKAPCEGMVLVDLVQWTKSQDSFKTFQNNQNRREAIELKFSCALCQQALEPSVFQGGNPPKGLETIETASRRTASHCPFFRLWSLSPRRTGIEARSILVREKFWQTKSKQAKHSKLRRTRHQQKWHWRNKT